MINQLFLSSSILILLLPSYSLHFFFFNDTATTEIYTLSLHDALPIYRLGHPDDRPERWLGRVSPGARSEEHTSELQSRGQLVCRLLLEKKKNKYSARVKTKKKKHKLFCNAIENQT